MLGTAEQLWGVRVIRLYAHMQGSFATVSLGLQEAFEDLNVLSGYHVGEQLEFDSEPVGGCDAPVAVVVGSPMRVLMAHAQGQHKEVWLMLAPNSEGIPPAMKAQLLEKAPSGEPLVTGFLAPSYWAQRVLEREFPDHPVVLCQHGLLQEFRKTPTLWKVGIEVAKPPFALHFTSSGLSRKCTQELINIWPEVVRNGFSVNKLVILSNPMFKPQIEEMIQDPEHVVVFNGQHAKLMELFTIYTQASLVIQPSRAEGFGLVPLEARACGTPVVMTRGTGHEDHCRTPTEKGCWRILPRGLEESDDYWGAQAPAVLQEDVAEGVTSALASLERLSKEAIEAAPQIREHWTWKAGAQEFVNRMQEKYV